MINFLKHQWIYFTISLVVILTGLFFIWRWGYNYSIDFVGGSNLEYRLDRDVNISSVQTIVRQENIELIDISLKNRDLLLRTKAIDEKKEAHLKQTLENQLPVKLTLLKSETVGPVLGREMMRKTGIASLFAISGILMYMSFAFKGFNFALAAVIALLHDFLVVMGVYAVLSHLMGAQIDTLFVTAVLTTMSFSVHDTIIIFDKIREYLRTQGKGNSEYYANRALTETLVRSVNNSMTIMFMLLALTLLGGSTIRFFAATLLVGTITGTYSSPFIATPIVVWLEKRRKN